MEGGLGAPTVWTRIADLQRDDDELNKAMGQVMQRVAVLENRFTSIERTQTRIINMLIAVLVAIIASGIGAIITVLVTRGK